MKRPGSPRPYGGQAHLYDHEYREYVDDIDLYLERLKAARVADPILELGAGTGRVAIPLAQAGFTVLGLDLSEPMLRRARARRRTLPPDAASRLRFTKQDMAAFQLRGPIGAVLVPFSGLALLPSPELRSACLERCAAHLRPGGLLMVDLFAPKDAAIGSQPGREPRAFRIPPYGHTVFKAVHEQFDAVRQVVTVTYTYQTRPFVGEEVLAELVVRFDLAVLKQEEVETALERAGFELMDVYGDYRGRPFGAKSGRMIFEARRR